LILFSNLFIQIQASPTQEATAFAGVRFLDDAATIQPSNKFGVNFGGGAEYQFGVSSFGLRADFRDHIMGVPRFSLPQAPTGAGGVFYPVSGQANNLEFSAGLVFYIP
jgi:hypothetical protein